MKNKPLVIVLSVLMMFTLLPCAGFAAENGEIDPTEPTQALVPEKGDTDLPESTEFSEDGALNVLDETESTEPTEPTESTEPIKEPWKSPSGSKLTSLSLCCNSSGTMFNLMANAGQKLYGYDTLQGGMCKCRIRIFHTI